MVASGASGPPRAPSPGPHTGISVQPSFPRCRHVAAGGQQETPTGAPGGAPGSARPAFPTAEVSLVSPRPRKHLCPFPWGLCHFSVASVRDDPEGGSVSLNLAEQGPRPGGEQRHPQPHPMPAFLRSQAPSTRGCGPQGGCLSALPAHLGGGSSRV